MDETAADGRAVEGQISIHGLGKLEHLVRDVRMRARAFVESGPVGDEEPVTVFVSRRLGIAQTLRVAVASRESRYRHRGRRAVPMHAAKSGEHANATKRGTAEGVTLLGHSCMHSTIRQSQTMMLALSCLLFPIQPALTRMKQCPQQRRSETTVLPKRPFSDTTAPGHHTHSFWKRTRAQTPTQSPHPTPSIPQPEANPHSRSRRVPAPSITQCIPALHAHLAAQTMRPSLLLPAETKKKG
ncbi:hypothetical protein BDZ85DRAFT_247698 [Elsinoe ampelina]|uniref:Uncharacterized protein n=1 Tax=Elsinoe ampelina TaxID=302913 RepID=A0A6A6GIU9_9PEZI|nr:hypothetical protein BDZ85DRAFT_247698 [Elsinoe ampelina]